MKTTNLFRFTLAILLFSVLVPVPAARAGDDAGSLLQFDGGFDQDRVTVADGVLLNVTTFTFEAWVNAAALDGEKSILSKGTGFGGGDSIFQLLDGRMRLFSGDFPWHEAATPIATGEWHHVAVTRDAAGNVTFYLDGEVDGTVAGTFAPAPGDGPFFLGLQGDACLCNEWDGLLDEVRVWNTVRSEADIRTTMFTSLTGGEPGLLAYWPLDSGSGQTVFDVSDTAGSDGVRGSGAAAGADDPEWVTPSTAPLSAPGLANDLTAVWSGRASSAGDPYVNGLDISDVSFLNEVGDDIVFAHNGAAFATTDIGVGPGVLVRWTRVWETVVSDPAGNDGRVELVFDIGDAGGAGTFDPADVYGLVVDPTAGAGDFAPVPVEAVNLVGDRITFVVRASAIAGAHVTVGQLSPFFDVAQAVVPDAGAQSYGVSWVDYDGDGDEDVYVCNFGDLNRLFRNDGGGSFLEVAAGPVANALQTFTSVWGDFDNSGTVEPYLSDVNNQLLSNTAGVFTDVSTPLLNDFGTGGNHRGNSAADYDNDGDLDLYLASFDAPNKLLRNDGGGAWSDATPGVLDGYPSSLTSSWADYDNDGDQDLYLVRFNAANHLFRNDGNGAFTDVTAGPVGDAGQTNGAAWGDYDNDGDLDLFLTKSIASRLLRNDGGGTFTDVTAGPLGGPAEFGLWGDLDNDGDLDLYVGTYGANNRLLDNDGGVFTDIATSPVNNFGNVGGGALADFDADGDLDIFVANLGSSNRLFSNQQSAGNHWLHVRLEGTLSNRAAIGARVRAVAGGQSRIREIAATEGSFSQGSLTVEFGLGAAAVVDTLEISWPGADPQILTGVAADQLLDVAQPVPPFVPLTAGPLGDGGSGFGVAWVDVDGDGDLDLYHTRSGQTNLLMLNDGAGAFTDATAPPLDQVAGGAGETWGDYDNDGDPDVYLVHNGAANVLLRNDGGTFTDVTAGPLGDTGTGFNAAWADYDLDGDLDLYLVNNLESNRLFRNDGGGVFTDVTAGPLAGSGDPARGLAWGDYDDDGDPDLYLTVFGANALLRNDGGGVFTDVTVPPLDDAGNGTGAAWGDYDNDGDLDLYLANLGQANRLFRNGEDVFSDVTAAPLDDSGLARSAVWADYDRDGLLDLFVANDGANRAFRNLGGGSFSDESAVLGLDDAGLGTGAAWGDADGDGDLDLYLANSGSANILYRNETATGNWLTVELEGAASNRSAIGARVRGVAGGVSRIRDVEGGSGFFSQNSLPVEFGLGGAATVDTLEIRWPSGAVQVQTGLAVNQALTVVEAAAGPVFADATAGPLGDAGTGRAVTWADYDVDGDPDLYLTNWGANRLLRNDGGVFTDVTAGPEGDAGTSQGAAWADYDNDGDPDLFVADGGGATSKLLRNDGGAFTDVTAGDLVDTGAASSVAWVDYDNDGRADLYLTFFGSPNRLYRNLGDDVFVDATPPVLAAAGSGGSQSWGDYDDDGDLDLYFSADGSPCLLIRNDGGGAFTDVTAPPLDVTAAGRGSAWGDYDNDGDLDLYLCLYDGPNRLFRNDGGGVFSDVTAAPLDDAAASHDAGWADVDNDGDLDLYVGNDQSPNRLFENTGAGFVDVTTAPLDDAGSAQGAAWADYDLDGDLDLYVADFFTANHLFRNDGAPGNWLHLDLAGTASNASAVGARVRVVADGGSRIREVDGGNGFVSQDSPRVEFGLGAASAADTVEIRWPSGQVETFTGVAGNMVHAYVEPAVSDSDGDGLDDLADACPFEAPGLGEVDRDYDGCPDSTASFRFIKFWSPDQLPVFYETDAAGDPRIGDGSDFAEIAAAFAAWTGIADITLAGGDDGTRGGPAITAAGDGRNSITFSDPKGVIPGILAITPTTSVVSDTVINGRPFRPGEIVDADMLFNASQFSFSTPSFPGPAGSFDLRSLATHEFGHFFGFSHSCVTASTMFYVVRPGPEARTLEEDDVVLARRGYAQTPPALSAEGRILRGDYDTPIPGAVVLAVADATGDTLQMTVSGLDGTFRLYDVPESFRIWTQPLDGGPEVNGLVAAAVNEPLGGVAETDFVAEYWDGGAESNSDVGAPGVVIAAPGPAQFGADIVVNPDLTGPTVVQVTPADGVPEAPAVGTVLVQFSEKLDLASVAGPPPGISLTEIATGNPVGGAAALLSSGTLLVFTPTAPLVYGADYELVVGPAITDVFGNPMTAPVSATFTVQPQPPVALTAVSPGAVPVGGQLVLSGTGFDPTAASNNIVNLPGAGPVPAQSATLDKLYLTVPPGTVSGPVSVQVGPALSGSLPLEIAAPKAAAKGNFVDAAALGAEPRQVAVRPDGAFAYVATANGVSAVDALPASAGFLDVTSIAIPGGCEAVAVLPSGDLVLAAGTSPPRLHVIDTDPASAAYHTVIDMVDLAAAPRGLAVVPGGLETLVSFVDRVALLSLSSGPLFGQEVRDWSDPNTGFLGPVKVSAGGQEAYAATGAGTVAVLGLGAGEGIVATLSAAPYPRDLAAAPQGAPFVAVGTDGAARLYGQRGPIQQTLPLDGELSGAAFTPDGGCVFLANYTQNRVEVLLLGSAGLSAGETFATGVDPQDLALGSGGRYVYVATDGQDLLEVYDTESGPLLTSLSPTAGGTGTLVSIGGSGFDPVPGNNVVTIDGLVHVPLDAAPDGTSLLVRQLANATSGPVRVETGGQTSNGLDYKVVNRFDPGNFAFGPDVIATGGPQPVEMLESPPGDLLVALHSDGSMSVLEAQPGSADFLRPVQVLAPGATGLAGPGEMAFTPDGRKLYVLDPAADEVAVFTVDPAQSAPVTRAGSVIDGGGPAAFLQPEGLDVTPDGRRLLAGSALDKVVYEVDAAADSVIGAIPGFASPPLALVVHPAGDLAYVGDNPGTGPIVRVVDIDPASPAYRTVIQTIPIAGMELGPLQMTADPDGEAVFAVVGDVVATSAGYYASMIDSDPASGTYHQVVNTASLGLDAAPRILPNHSGTVLYVLDRNGVQVTAWDIETLDVDYQGPLSTQFAASTSFALSRDDARLYVPAFGDRLISVDLSEVSGFAPVSGLNQVGVAGTPLPAPIVFRMTAADPTLAEGGLVGFLASPASGDFGFGDGRLYAAAAEDGLVEAAYTAGPNAGTDTVSVQSFAGVASLQFTVLADTSAAPPQILAVAPDGTANPPGVNTPVAVDFSKAIDPASVSTSTFVLRPTAGSALPGKFTYANAQRRVVFQPAQALTEGAVYEIELTTGLEDYDGNALATPGTFAFTTAAAFPLIVHAVDAPSAQTGVPVVVSGHGFGTDPAQSTVLFGSVAAPILSGDSDAFLTLVPLGAQTGPLRVVVGPDTSNAVTFQVLPPPVAPVNQTVAEVEVPVSGQQIVVVPDGSRAYMTAPGSNAVVPIHVRSQVSEPAIGAGLHPFGVTASPSGDRVFVSNFLSHDVSVIDADSTHSTFKQVIATIPAGLNPSGVAAHPDGRTLYVSNYGDSTVSVLDTDSTSAAVYSARASIPTDNGATSTVVVTPDGGRIVIGTSYGLVLVDTRDYGARQSIPTDSGTQAVTITPDGGLAVVLTTSNELVLIDIVPGSPTEGQARATIPTDNTSTSVTVSPDGGFVYVSNGNGTVDVFQIVQTGGTGASVGGDGCCGGLSLVPVQSFAVGENPTGLSFDPSGSGLLLVINSGSKTVSFINTTSEYEAVAADLEFTPNTLNLNSNGKFVTAYVEFPPARDPADVDIATVRLEGALAAIADKSGIGDQDGDGIADWAFKFSRQDLFDVIEQGQRVPVTVTGMIGAEPFTATDTVRVMRPQVVKPAPQDMVTAAGPAEIRWVPAPDGPADHVDIFWSADNGASWDTVVVGTPDDSLHVWEAPVVESEECLVMIVAMDARDQVLGIGVTPEPFSILRVLGEIPGTLPARFGLLAPFPNPFRAGTAISFEMPEPAEVDLNVYAIDGSLVRVLADGRPFPAGRHTLAWDGSDERGRRVSAGIYFMRITAGRDHAVRKVVRVN